MVQSTCRRQNSRERDCEHSEQCRPRKGPHKDKGAKGYVKETGGQGQIRCHAIRHKGRKCRLAAIGDSIGMTPDSIQKSANPLIINGFNR